MRTWSAAARGFLANNDCPGCRGPPNGWRGGDRGRLEDRRGAGLGPLCKGQAGNPHHDEQAVRHQDCEEAGRCAARDCPACTPHMYMQPATLATRVIASSPRRHRRQNGAGPDRGRYSEEGGPDFLRRPARARATLTALSSTGQSPVHCPLLRCHREGRPNLLLHGAVRARPRTPRARRPPPSLLSLLSRQPHPSNPAARVCGDVAL